MTAEIIIFACAAALSAGLCVLSAKRLLHSLQQSNYIIRAYFKDYGRNFIFIRYQYLIGAAGFALFALFYVILPRAEYGCLYLTGLLPYFMMLGAYTFCTLRVKTKKPLAYTGRMKRLTFTLSALCLVFAPLGFLLLSLLVPLAAAINKPLENRINNGFIRSAQSKLEAMPALIKIGVTGSYGKTSVKFYLYEMLKSKYKVCVSPQSYNTPLGMARVINDSLKPDDEVLIAEMGARRPGDIKYLCSMIKPSLGILTSVGAQHLETFKCICNVMSAKYELVENLYPLEGITRAVFNCDNEYVSALYQRKEPRGVERINAGAGKNNRVYYTVSETGAEGTAFSLYINGGKFDCRTTLLGLHNISNICAAAAAADALGVAGGEIAAAVSRLKPAEHRLQLIKGAGGVSVIDDAYNSNPQGARAAIDALAAFPGGKVVVTPGMVELGAAQYLENREFGAYMAGRADYCIAIGQNAAAIGEGFLSAGGDKERLKVCADLKAAQEILKAVLKPGDTVLFENDLPDV